MDSDGKMRFWADTEFEIKKGFRRSAHALFLMGGDVLGLKP
ncbi:hypothetical protein CCACVL1_19879 [Corchorus capsularis]|uniref:Uncharacterized protein n=1 Tax=Corchorus capsularis TaxID=210143 RepID=A0A1R3HEA4_COCAP|nr:hypothetical protein CCACVL1_19879 [Corchorus capsularis]